MWECSGFRDCCEVRSNVGAVVRARLGDDANCWLNDIEPVCWEIVLISSSLGWMDELEIDESCRWLNEVLWSVVWVSSEVVAWVGGMIEVGL